MTFKGGAISVPFSCYQWLSKCKKFCLKSKALIGYTGLLGGVGVTGQGKEALAYRAHGPVL